jgi:hypothetical protein
MPLAHAICSCRAECPCHMPMPSPHAIRPCYLPMRHGQCQMPVPFVHMTCPCHLPMPLVHAAISACHINMPMSHLKGIPRDPHVSLFSPKIHAECFTSLRLINRSIARYKMAALRCVMHSRFAIPAPSRLPLPIAFTTDTSTRRVWFFCSISWHGNQQTGTQTYIQTCPRTMST